MASVELTKENFEQTVTREGIVLVDFWAAWCGPCRQFGPVYEQVSDNHDDVIFGKVDTEAQSELAGMFQVRSIPTLMVFRDGLAVFQQAGALPAEVLEDLVRQVRGLNMDEVRTQVAEHLHESQQQAEQEGGSEEA